MVEVDMHTHSYFSDGYDSPREILMKAKRIGLKAVCLTDHDVFHGLAEFKTIAQELDIDTISGIEITTKFFGIYVHILGYGIEYIDKLFLSKVLSKQWEICNTKSEGILKKYANDNIMRTTLVSIRKKLRCYGPVVFPLHIRLYRSLMYDIPFEETKKEIWRGGKFWSHTNKNLLLSLKETIDFIHKFKGTVVLAHPGKFCREANLDMKISLKIFFQLLDFLQEKGLKGIESYSPKHSEKQNKLFAGLAKDRGLIATGGSDYHGFFDAQNNFGKVGISYEQFLQIKNLCLK